MRAHVCSPSATRSYNTLLMPATCTLSPVASSPTCTHAPLIQPLPPPPAAQSYNTLLTLSHLHTVSDGIITLENDALHQSCTRLMNIARPSLHVSVCACTYQAAPVSLIIYSSWGGATLPPSPSL